MEPNKTLKGAEDFVNKIEARLLGKKIFEFIDISEIVEIPGNSSTPLYMQKNCRYIRVGLIDPGKDHLITFNLLGHGIVEVTNKSLHPIKIKIQGRNDE